MWCVGRGSQHDLGVKPPTVGDGGGEGGVAGYGGGGVGGVGWGQRAGSGRGLDGGW
jgi:hypothetical protein